ncbi:MAG TPA: hypothetical protein VHC22_29160 [Pirellulales bacterium]|nr:hypothetical protein [Pirellulales bacterium]
MPRIATRHAHQLAYRRRFSLGVRMLGCLVLLAGTLLMAAALVGIASGPMTNSIRVMGLVGALLFLAGAALFCGERGMLFDLETRTLRRWWGIVFPLIRSVHDLNLYQDVEVQPHDAAGLVRWRVALKSPQGECLNLFDLPSLEAARLAARQVGALLSLRVGPSVADSAAAPLGHPVATTAAPATAAVSADNRWAYREPFGLFVRGLGVVCLTLGIALLAGMLTSGESGRWPAALAMLVPLWLFGAWLVLGGHRVEVDGGERAVRAWRAWPLPPAVYELTAFYAVIVAPTGDQAADSDPPKYLVGLMGADQLRLPVIDGLPRDEAVTAATQLASAAGLPLLDDSPAAAPPRASVAG